MNNMDYNYTQSNLKPTPRLTNNAHIPYKNNHKQNLSEKKRKKNGINLTHTE